MVRKPTRQSSGGKVAFYTVRRDVVSSPASRASRAASAGETLCHPPRRVRGPPSLRSADVGPAWLRGGRPSPAWTASGRWRSSLSFFITSLSPASVGGRSKRFTTAAALWASRSFSCSAASHHHAHATRGREDRALSLGQFYWRRFLALSRSTSPICGARVLQAWGRTHLDERPGSPRDVHREFHGPPRGRTRCPTSVVSVEEHFYVVWPLSWRSGRLAAAGTGPGLGRLGAWAALAGAAWLPRQHLMPPSGVLDFHANDDIGRRLSSGVSARDAAWRRRLDGFVADGRRLALTATASCVQLLVSHQVGGSLLPPVP